MSVLSSPLPYQIASGILDRLRDGRLLLGVHIAEHALCSEFQVSRSPVREALKLLASRKLLVQEPRRGFFTPNRISRAEMIKAQKDFNRGDNDSLYLEIGAQRLDGTLPDQFTEAELARRFALSRLELSRVVNRLAHEGWIERRPGYGWKFAPALTTPEAFALGYRFRLAIEPAALLEPTFVIDQAAFATCRQQQTAIFERRLCVDSPVELFAIGSMFHEMLARCSGNPFFLESLQRINRQRRVLEFRAMIDTAAFSEQAGEHLAILDLIERGRRRDASNLLRHHLDSVREVKLAALAHRPSRKTPRRPIKTVRSGIVAQVHF